MEIFVAMGGPLDHAGMGRLLNKSNQLRLQLLSVIGNAITITVFIKSNQLIKMRLHSNVIMLQNCVLFLIKIKRSKVWSVSRLSIIYTDNLCHKVKVTVT